MGKAPEKIPRARGFERDFSLLDGGGNYWDMRNVTARSPRLVFTEDGLYLSELPKDYYATKTYTDKMIEFIETNRGDDKPFFAYVAHQAPHDPFHLPREWRRRHVGEYDKGWDALRRVRLKRQIELGIVAKDTQLAERMWFVPDPTQLAPAPRALLGMKMELYAGMMENFDHHVGRLVDYLKSVGEYENTIFIAFGDNGAEGADLFEMIAGTPGTLNALSAAINWSQPHPKAWGDPESFVGYGPMWAQVSMTPFSQYKAWLAEGGIRNALIVSGPAVKRPDGSIHHAVMHVADIMPTLLDIAGAEYPETHEGRRLPPLIGKSWTRLLAGEVESVQTDEDYLAWEIFGNRALRQGIWKLRWHWPPSVRRKWPPYTVDISVMERALNSRGATQLSAVARQETGVLETFASALKVTMSDLAKRYQIASELSSVQSIDEWAEQTMLFTFGVLKLDDGSEYVSAEPSQAPAVAAEPKVVRVSTPSKKPTQTPAAPPRRTEPPGDASGLGNPPTLQNPPALQDPPAIAPSAAAAPPAPNPPVPPT